MTATIDRAAVAARGVVLGEVLDTLWVHFGQAEVGQLERFGRTWQVRVKLDFAAGDQAEEWKKLRVRDSQGRLVPLSDLVVVREVEAPAAVERLNLRPMVVLTANPAPGVSLTTARAACEALAEEVRRELGLLSDEYRLTWL